MKSLYEIMINVLNEIERKDTNITVTGGRGYGAGKAYPNKTVSVSNLLGKEYKEDPEEYKLKKVEISKAFKKEKK